MVNTIGTMNAVVIKILVSLLLVVLRGQEPRKILSIVRAGDPQVLRRIEETLITMIH